MLFQVASLNTPADTVAQNAAWVLNVSATLAQNSPAEKKLIMITRQDSNQRSQSAVNEHGTDR